MIILWKMKDNLIEWSIFYKDILDKYYFEFVNLFIFYNEEIPSYKEFVVFCYNNTKKNVICIPGFYKKELRAPLII
jgi:hypothetical protein